MIGPRDPKKNKKQQMEASDKAIVAGSVVKGVEILRTGEEVLTSSLNPTPTGVDAHQNWLNLTKSAFESGHGNDLTHLGDLVKVGAGAVVGPLVAAGTIASASLDTYRLWRGEQGEVNKQILGNSGRALVTVANITHAAGVSIFTGFGSAALLGGIMVLGSATIPIVGPVLAAFALSKNIIDYTREGKKNEFLAKKGMELTQELRDLNVNLDHNISLYRDIAELRSELKDLQEAEKLIGDFQNPATTPEARKEIGAKILKLVDKPTSTLHLNHELALIERQIKGLDAKYSKEPYKANSNNPEDSLTKLKSLELEYLNSRKETLLAKKSEKPQSPFERIATLEKEISTKKDFLESKAKFMPLFSDDPKKVLHASVMEVYKKTSDKIDNDLALAQSKLLQTKHKTNIKISVAALGLAVGVAVCTAVPFLWPVAIALSVGALAAGVAVGINSLLHSRKNKKLIEQAEKQKEEQLAKLSDTIGDKFKNELKADHQLSANLQVYMHANATTKQDLQTIEKVNQKLESFYNHIRILSQDRVTKEMKTQLRELRQERDACIDRQVKVLLAQHPQLEAPYKAQLAARTGVEEAWQALRQYKKEMNGEKGKTPDPQQVKTLETNLSNELKKLHTADQVLTKAIEKRPKEEIPVLSEQHSMPPMPETTPSPDSSSHLLTNGYDATVKKSHEHTPPKDTEVVVEEPTTRTGSAPR